MRHLDDALVYVDVAIKRVRPAQCQRAIALLGDAGTASAFDDAADIDVAFALGRQRLLITQVKLASDVQRGIGINGCDRGRMPSVSGTLTVDDELLALNVTPSSNVMAFVPLSV